MTGRKTSVTVVAAWTGLLLTTTAAAQSQDAAATRPAADGDGSLVYEVTAVKGKVRVGPNRLKAGQGGAWTYVKVGDRVGAGQQIQVFLRGAVKLAARPAEPPTVILIERSSLVNISELALKGGVARSRIGLAYGAIRAGVAEGRTRSDMEIESPVATLSKRGTDIFRFEYRNRRFMMSLSEQGRGMIQAIQMQSTAFGSLTRKRSRFVTPGQFVTHRMARAIDNVQFDRRININDVFGIQGLDELFTLLNDHGIGFLLPQGSNPLGFLDAPTPSGNVGTVPDFDADVDLPSDQLARPALDPLLRLNAGDFGIGQGRLPGVFGVGARVIGGRLEGCRGVRRGECVRQMLQRSRRR